MKSAKDIAYSLLETLATRYRITSEDAIRIYTDWEWDYPLPNREVRSPQYLIWMCVQVIQNAHTWEIDKQHRWIGFIQKGVIDLADPDAFDGLDLERDRVRHAPGDPSF